MKTKEKPHWFGLPAPREAELAWGARAAPRSLGMGMGGRLEFYPDRQQMTDPEHPRKKELMDWINSLELQKSERWDYDDGDKHIRGEERMGYICFVAWIDKEKKRGSKHKRKAKLIHK